MKDDGDRYYDRYDAMERLVSRFKRQGLYMEVTGGDVDFPAKDFHFDSYYVRALVMGPDDFPGCLSEPGRVVFVVSDDQDEEFDFDGDCAIRYSSVRAAIKALANMKPAKVEKIVKPFIERHSKDFIVTCVKQKVKNVKDKQGRVVRSIIDKSYEDKTVRALSSEHAEYIVQLQYAHVAGLQGAIIIEEAREVPKPRKPRARKSA